jgi:hypothetical protein
MATIIVSSGAELTAAYAELVSNGGGTILLEEALTSRIDLTVRWCD